MKTFSDNCKVYFTVKQHIDLIKTKQFSKITLNDYDSFIELSPPGWNSIFDNAWDFKVKYSNLELIDLEWHNGGIKFHYSENDWACQMIQSGLWRFCRRQCMVTGKTYSDQVIVHARKEIEDWPVLEQSIYIQYLNEEFDYNKSLIDRESVK